MARIIAAGFAGAVIYFIWGMLAWMAIPLHTPTIHSLPTETAITDALKSQNLETGVYVSPFAADPADMGNPDSEFMKNHTTGPIFSIYYRKDGSAPMNAGVLVSGFLIDLLAAILAATLLSSIGACGRSFWCRVGFVAGLGAFTALVGHLSYWNWMHFPIGYTMAFVIDVIVGWALAGLAIAFLIQPNVVDSTSSAGAVESKAPAPIVSPKPEPATPLRNDAINLLATLQREARFIDIVKEPLSDYSDAQIGAAARDVLRDCGVVLDRLFKLEPVVEKEEGASIDIPSGPESAQYRLAGNSSGEATSGSLVHHGWRAKQCELPRWTGAKAATLIVAPAELEVKASGS